MLQLIQMGVQMKAMSFTQNYRSYLVEKARLAGKGNGGICGWVSLVVGALLSALLCICPEWTRAHVSDTMNAFLVGLLPVTAGASVFVLRWIYSGYALYKDKTNKLAELQERLRPRIRVSCGSDIEGCVVPDHRGIWYRARLDLTGVNVSGLEASIVRLSEDCRMVDLFGEYLVVSMCMSEQLGQTTLIREGRPEYINIAFAANGDEKPPVLSLKHYPGSAGDKVYLKLGHQYRMEVVLNCDDTHPALRFSVDLKLASYDRVEEFRVT